MKKVAVIGLGTMVLCDDAAGLAVVSRAENLLSKYSDEVDFKQNCSGGLDMLSDMEGYDRVIIVDSIMTGRCEPGTCLEYTVDDFSHNSTWEPAGSHGFSLPVLLDAGRMCGYRMPGEFALFAIEAADLTTFSEQLTEEVARSVDGVVEKIGLKIASWLDKV